MKIKKIYFDMDGVLADFERGVKEMCGMEVPPQEPKYDSENDMMWEKIRQVEHFYDRLKPMPGALEMFNTLNSRYDCEILTAVPKPKRGIVTADDDKKRWVKRILSDEIKVNIVVKEEKKNFAEGPESILIDDYEGNISDWKKFGGTGICFSDAETTLITIDTISD